MADDGERVAAAFARAHCRRLRAEPVNRHGQSGGGVDGGLPATGEEREIYDAQRSAFGIYDLLAYVRCMGLDWLDAGPEEQGSDGVGVRRSPASALIGRPAS